MARLHEKLRQLKEASEESIIAALKKDIQGEKDAIGQYKERILQVATVPKLAHIESKLKEILKDEEDHLKILEGILDKQEGMMDLTVF
jgi:rubrerythrin